MRNPERRRIAAKLGDPVEQRGIGGARQQKGEQCIFLGARGVDLVRLSGMFGVVTSTNCTRLPASASSSPGSLIETRVSPSSPPE